MTGSSAYGGNGVDGSRQPKLGNGLNGSPSVVSLHDQAKNSLNGINKRNASKDSSIRRNGAGRGGSSDNGGGDLYADEIGQITQPNGHAALKQLSNAKRGSRPGHSQSALDNNGAPGGLAGNSRMLNHSPSQNS